MKTSLVSLCVGVVLALGSVQQASAANRGLPAGAKEDPSARTVSSSTYHLRNGSTATVLSSERVNFRDAHGTWRRIDDRLHRTASGTVVNGQGPLDVELPKRLSQPITVTRNERSLRMRLLGAEGPIQLDGPTAWFDDALRGVDVMYSMRGGGLKETLRVHGADVPDVYRFALDLRSGLSLDDRGPRGIDVLDEHGKAILVVEPAVMWDADDPTATMPVPMTVEHRGRRTLLVLRPDAAWLRVHAAGDGVVIDPTIVLPALFPSGAVSQTPVCGIDSSHPFSPQSSCFGGNIGWSGTIEYRSLLRFDLSSLIGARVKTATLDGDVLTQNASGHYVAQEIARNWDACVSWTRATMVGDDGTDCAIDDTFWSTAGGDVTGRGTATISESGSGFDTLQADVTVMAQDWINHPSSNHGMLLRASDHSAVTTISIGEDGTFTPPKLIVIWAPELGKPDGHELQEDTLTDRLSLFDDVGIGNVLLEGRDVHVASRGLPFDLTRSYNSLSSHVGMFGRGMTSNLGLDQRIVPVDGSLALSDPNAIVTLVDDSGRDLDFLPGTLSGGVTTYTTQTPDYSGTLTHLADGTWTLVERDGTKRSFDSGGYLTTVADKDQNAIRLTYGTSPKRPTTLTDSQGRDYALTYNADGLIASVTDQANRVWSYTYATDGSKRMLTSTDPENGVTTYGWTSSTGRINRIVTPFGRITKLTYGTDGRVASITRVTNRTTEAGDTITITHNVPCNSPGCVDGLGATLTDERGHRWVYNTDLNGRVTSVQVPAGPAITQTFNTAGQLATRRVGGATWITSHDPSDPFHVTATTDPVGVRASETYDPSHPDDIASTTDDLGKTISYSYTSAPGTPAAGRLTTATVSGLGTVYQYAYNGFGELQHVTTGAGNPVVDYGYNNSGELTSVTRPNPRGNETISYDGLSRVQGDTDASLRSRTTTYDKLDRPTLIQYSGGTSIAYEYDKDGNKTKRTVTPTSGSPDITMWSYDDKNRVTDQTLPGSTTTHYDYDATDNLTGLTDAGGAIAYGYDDANRLTSITEPPLSGQAQVTQIGYDANGYRATVTTPNGRKVTYTLNGAGRQTAMTLAPSGGGSALVSRSYSYVNPDPNAPQSTTTKVFSETNESSETTSYAYDDPLGRLSAATVKDGAGAQIASYGYAYDAQGNMTRRVKDGVTTFLAVDGASLLNGLGPVQGSPSTTFSWDASGFLTSSNAGLTLQYNPKRQTTVLRRDSGTFAVSVDYADATQSEPTKEGTTTVTNDELGIASRTTTAGSTYYTRTPDGDRIAERAPSGRYYFANDRQDSVLALTDTTGAVARKLRYDPYGETTLDTGAGPTAFTYAGGEAVAAGFLRFGERYYMPSLGRWTQPDSIEQAEDVLDANPFTYAGDDPTNRVDPTGRSLLGNIAQIAAGAAGIAVGVTVVGVCAVATDGLGAVHCGTAGAAVITGGGILLSTGLDGLTGHHRKSKRRRRR